MLKDTKKCQNLLAFLPLHYIPFQVITSYHRALIFCQFKSMLDFIENQLFKKVLPSVAYLRLDGSVPINRVLFLGFYLGGTLGIHRLVYSIVQCQKVFFLGYFHFLYQRFGLVSQFNEDSSIDVLLLTTSVGGLGLNLTGADTVNLLFFIFYLFIFLLLQFAY